MAGSRLHKIGNIFTRTTGLIKSGIIKENEKPLWYDVYAAFPPKSEPCYDIPPPDIKLRKIFYPEDAIRATFYQRYPNIGIINLNETSTRQSICQKFVEKYVELQVETQNEEEIIEKVEVLLENEGIKLRKDADVEGDSTTLPDQSKQLHLAQLFKLGIAEEKRKGNT